MPLGLEVDALRVGTLGPCAADICRWLVVQKLMVDKSGELKGFDLNATRTGVREMVEGC